MKIATLLLSFYMLIGGLIPQTDFSQLKHLPDLRAHYLEHKTEAELQNKLICVFEFLYAHFINIHTDADHEEDHHQLPFQNISSSVDFLVTSLVLPELSSSDTIFLQNLAYQSPFYLCGFLSITVHPPSFS